MLIRRHGSGLPKAARGFSLIELMISVLIGLIVAAGAVALIVAIDRANSETIQSTRLTQELRSIASVIADDIKRARRIADPVGMVGYGTTNTCATTPTVPAQPCYTITPSTTATQTVATLGVQPCMTYGYTGTTGSSTLYNYRFIWLNGTSVELDQWTFDPTGLANGTQIPVPPTQTTLTTCSITKATPTHVGTPTTVQISSQEVSITALTFTYINGGEIDLSLTGKLIKGDAYTNTVSRTFTQPIFIRSGTL
ncbi:MAG TPA: prepilin-type N-terminal cleavage/methylation domain-containing protein [Rudaea sp.]|jgi:prepilin-type N-terminal cleavage/methylation domain-containing protein